MDVTCVIQARMGSTRLPGKVLLEVGEWTVLGLMLARLAPLSERAGWTIVVATSDRQSDDPIVEVVSASGVAVARGPEDDVLRRVVGAVERHPADVIVRLTADCPLADPGVVSDAVGLHRRERFDYTSNTLLRTFPDGLDIEVIDPAALRAADVEAADPTEREHVTPFVYRRPSRFRLGQLMSPMHAGEERWTIDTAADLEWLRRAVALLDAPVEASWIDVLDAVGRTPSGADRLRLVACPPETRTDGFVRRWTLRRGEEDVGLAEVVVDDGRGRLRLDTAADVREEARQAVVHALGADAQVAVLEEET